MIFDDSSVLLFIAQGIQGTVVITLTAFAIGAVAGVPVALMRLSSVWLLRAAGTLFVELTRGVPALVWLMVFFYGIGQYLGLEPLLAACLALGVVSTAHLAEIYRAAIRSVARGQSEAAAALGLNSRQKFWRITAPQGIEVATPPAATYGIGLIKESAAASVIGAADIAFWASVATQQGRPALPVFVLAGLVYLVVSLPVAGLSRYVDHKIRLRVAVR